MFPTESFAEQRCVSTPRTEVKFLGRYKRASLCSLGRWRRTDDRRRQNQSEEEEEEDGRRRKSGGGEEVALIDSATEGETERPNELRQKE